MGLYLGQVYFFVGRLFIALGKRWGFGYRDWSDDPTMAKAYIWSLYVGPLELRWYQARIDLDD